MACAEISADVVLVEAVTQFEFSAVPGTEGEATSKPVSFDPFFFKVVEDFFFDVGLQLERGEFPGSGEGELLPKPCILIFVIEEAKFKAGTTGPTKAFIKVGIIAFDIGTILRFPFFSNFEPCLSVAGT